MGLGFLVGGGGGGVCVQHLHFLKVAPTLGSVKSSIPRGAWRFHFFPNSIFAKIRVHLELPIHRSDFSFMKKCNHKKFQKNCCCNGSFLYPSLVQGAFEYVPLIPYV
jgi:hypothetical protein